MRSRIQVKKIKVLQKGTGNIGGKPKVKAKQVSPITQKVSSDVYRSKGMKSKISSLASRMFGK